MKLFREFLTFVLGLIVVYVLISIFFAVDPTMDTIYPNARETWWQYVVQALIIIPYADVTGRRIVGLFKK